MNLARTVAAATLALSAVVLAVAVFTRPTPNARAEGENVSGKNPQPTQEIRSPDQAAPEPPDLGPTPALVEIDGWLQSRVTSLAELRGQVVIVQFWTFGCHNCKATLPHLQSLYEAYHDDGLEIVGIHSPEFSYEKDEAAIAAAAEQLGVTWPIVLDTERSTFREWQGRPAYWPRTYVVDQAGHIRFDHVGEGKYSELREVVSSLLTRP